MNELDLIEKIRRMSLGQRGIALGIGDDCAIFRPRTGEDLLFTTDQMIEGVHFRTGERANRIGERALARSLSDIAAMGGEPRFCLVSLAVPGDSQSSETKSNGSKSSKAKRGDSKWITGYYRGLLALAKRTRTVLAGGDLARAPQIYCDVMVCGSIAQGRALKRDGARPGDALYVSGRLGKPWERRIEPRLALGKSLVGHATSCMDLSDGLSIDLHRLCVASGVAAELDRVPIARGSTLERALHGGEDYELLFTLPPGKKAPGATVGISTTRIGTIVKGLAGVIRFQGELLKPLGYDHFR